MPTGTQWDEISDLQHIIMNIITCKKLNLNKLCLRKKQFASLVGMLWITCLYHRQLITLIGSKLKSTQYLTYSQIRSNIISNTKNNYTQLSIKYSFKKQSDLVNLGMYLTLHIYDISYSIIIKITPWSQLLPIVQCDISVSWQAVSLGAFLGYCMFDYMCWGLWNISLNQIHRTIRTMFLGAAYTPIFIAL